jgi:hypothetical protein
MRRGGISTGNLANLATQAVLGAGLLWLLSTGNWHNEVYVLLVQLQGTCFLLGVIRAGYFLHRVPSGWKPTVARNAMVLGLSLLLSAPAAWMCGQWL